MTSKNVTKIITLAILFLYGIFVNFTPPVDPDFGWHYKYGEYFSKNFALPRENIFSYILPEYHWNNSYWLFDVFLYITHATLGHAPAVILFSVVITLLLLTYLHNKTQNLATLILAFALVMGMLGEFRIAIRPHFFSSIFMLFLLETLLVSHKWKKFLPFVFLFWANFHAEFLVGFFVFGLYLAEEMIRSLCASHKINLENLRVFGMSLVATLINPYGIKLWFTLFNELGLPAKSVVQEWGPLDFSSIGAYYSFIPFFAIPFTFLFINAKPRNSQPWWYFIAIMFFSIFMFKSVYMIRVLLILSIPALIYAIDLIITKYKLHKWATGATYLVITVTTLISGVTFLRFAKLATSTQLWSNHWAYPYEAVQILKTLPKDGQLFNAYAWGGYLIWQLPEFKTFADGRMTSWPYEDRTFMSFYKQVTLDVGNNQEMVEKVFNEHNIKYVLEQQGSKLVAYLLTTDNWQKVYEDKNSVLLQRSSVFANRKLRTPFIAGKF